MDGPKRVTSRARNYWTAEEDRILREQAALQLRTAGSVKHWNCIAEQLPARSNKDCRKRWSKLQTNVNKGLWRSDEDDRLRRAVGQHGFAWTVVAQDVQTRHADQCAKRWHHSLNPNLIHETWTPDEDDRLVDAVDTYGRSWRVISEKEFPRRSATDIKNRYLVVQRRRGNGQDFSRLHPVSPSDMTSSVSPGSSSNMGSASPDAEKMDEEELKQLRLAARQLFNHVPVPFSPLLKGEDDPSLLFPDVLGLAPPFPDHLFSAPLSLGSPSTPGDLVGGEDDFMTGLSQFADQQPLPVFAGGDSSFPIDLTTDAMDLLEFSSSGIPDTPGLSGEEAAQKYTLLLEGVQPDMLTNIMDVVCRSRQEVKMKMKMKLSGESG